MKARLSRGRVLVVTTAIFVIAAGANIVSCRGNYGGTDQDGGSFLSTGNTKSHFRAIQVDPRSEDSAGPQFVAAEDLNGDGLLDLVSAWNESQPVQIHFQSRTATGTISFETITLAGNEPTVKVAGLALADFDGDGRTDVAVLIKRAGALSGGGCLTDQDGIDPDEGICDDGEECSIAAQDCADESRCREKLSVNGAIVIYLGPTDAAQANQALAWEVATIGAAVLSGSGEGLGVPEEDGYTSMAVGDIDVDGDLDIVAAWNTDCGPNHVLLFTNEGYGQVRNGTWPVSTMPNLFGEDTTVKDVALADVDRDGDLDVIATRPNSETVNLHWFRNPTIDIPDDFHFSDTRWQEGTIGQVEPSADVISVGDVDQDGIVDVVVRSTLGRLIQWLKGPAGPTTSPVRSIPWQVFTIAEFSERSPEALAVGDINFDGQLEIIASAQGGLVWFDSQAAPSVFDQWTENLIIDDQAASGTSSGPGTTDPNVTPSDVTATTFINSILVVDMDGDGANDLVATFDRGGLSGVTNDALIWFQNTRNPPG